MSRLFLSLSLARTHTRSLESLRRDDRASTTRERESLNTSLDTLFVKGRGFFKYTGKRSWLLRRKFDTLHRIYLAWSNVPNLRVSRNPRFLGTVSKYKSPPSRAAQPWKASEKKFLPPSRHRLPTSGFYFNSLIEQATFQLTRSPRRSARAFTATTIKLARSSRRELTSPDITVLHVYACARV